jgi:16S rRNA (guanine527-N7)-methyltransferase
MPIELIVRYFPDLTAPQEKAFGEMESLYLMWNQKINLISRKDMENLVERHFLHSLAIAKFFNFEENSRILDVGTGGGFPGIPLSVLLPHCKFHLVDSIGKKIKVVQDVVKSLGLQNVISGQVNSAHMKGQFDYIVSRAVTRLPDFIQQTLHLLKKNGKILYLKGGDFDEELEKINQPIKIHKLSDVFDGTFFETKKLVIIG